MNEQQLSNIITAICPTLKEMVPDARSAELAASVFDNYQDLEDLDCICSQSAPGEDRPFRITRMACAAYRALTIDHDLPPHEAAEAVEKMLSHFLELSQSDRTLAQLIAPGWREFPVLAELEKRNLISLGDMNTWMPLGSDGQKERRPFKEVIETETCEMVEYLKLHRCERLIAAFFELEANAEWCLKGYKVIVAREDTQSGLRCRYRIEQEAPVGVSVCS